MPSFPGHWKAVLLKEVVTNRKGKRPKYLSNKKTDGSVPYIDIKAFSTGEVRQYADIKTSNLASREDVLVVWDGARSGLVGIGQEGAIGSTIMALRPITINTTYLCRFLQTQYETINSNPRGTGIPHIDPELFWNIKFPIAPRNEQRLIVAKLEKLLAKVKACQERLNKIPTILKRFRQSVLTAACSGRLTVDWREDHRKVETAFTLLQKIREHRLAKAYSKKELNQIKKAVQTLQSLNNGKIEYTEIPESWVYCNVGAIGTICNGSTPSRKNHEFWGGKIPWVSSGEVHNNVISETREKITKFGYEGCSVRLLPRGTVLLAMIGEGKTRGQTAILEIEATINQNIAAIILDHGMLHSRYLWHWFQLQYHQTREQGSGSGPQALNCQRVRELPFILPPFVEQHEIIRRVEALFKIADKIEERYKKAKAYIDKLTQSILAKAFRGELVPQDPNDEPASVLLERIRSSRVADSSERKARRRRRSKRKA
jgi:type I restriction enzyme S subunit